ncbi:MAG: hypothetical protein PHD56_00685 [Anaerostipes sp.]|nr:hypothetical protein [Anaerostipes sp.]
MQIIILSSTYNKTYNGDGSDYYTSSRAKKDKSVSYVNNNGTDTHSITAAVANGSSFKIRSSYYVIKKGNRKYIKNTVYQNGGRTARIAMGATSGKKVKCMVFGVLIIAVDIRSRNFGV